MKVSSKAAHSFFESLFGLRDGWVGQFEVPSFSKGASSFFAHLVEKDQYGGLVVFVDFVVHGEVCYV